MMIFKNCLSIVIEELKICKKIFVLYLFIFICLISIGTSMLDLSFYLPERISTSISNMNLDWIVLDIRNTKQLNLITSKYDIDFLDMEINEFQNSTLGLPQSNETLYSGGILLDICTENDTLIKNIKENLLYQEEPPTSQASNDKNYNIFISEKVAEENELKINQKIDFKGRNGNALGALHIVGIYTDSEDLRDYYLNQSAYELYKQNYQNCTIQITLKNRIFKNIFSFISFVQKNKLKCDYNKDMIGAIQMFYIFFLLLNFIILLALTGNLFHLIEIYILRRSSFYAINLALGMTQRDILYIIYLLSQIMINTGMFFSCFFSSFLLKSIRKFASELFLFSTDVYVPVLALIANWFLLQLCISIVIIRFKSKVNRNEIIDILRYE